MSQIIWDTIIPSTTSGNQLAQLLNDFKDAVVSGLSGTSRPSQLQAGGYWIDTTTTTWVMKIYTGTVDVPIVNINSTTGVASVVSAENLFAITKSSDDTVGPFLELIKKRLAGGGQTLDGDSLGEVSFKGTRDDSVVVKQAGIRAVSTDNVTATAQGAAVVVEAMNDNTATLTEIARFVGGRLGIGQTAPTEKLEVLNGNIKTKNLADSAVGPKNILTKRRSSGGGQTLTNDSLGQVVFQGTQSNGTEVDLIKIEGYAYENTDASAHGAELLISVKNPGTETYFNAIRVVNGQVEIGGVPIDGSLSYQGAWNANTNTPDITASPVKGQYWIVNVAGNTNIDGITDWGLGDWAIYNGTVFQKIDNSDSVVSVNGYQGVVVLGANDIAESTTRYWDVKNFRNATVDPTVSNDSTENYTVGSTWFNTNSDTLFLCKDASAGAAVWVVASGSGGGGLDVFDAENFERLSVADFSKNQNASYLGTGGTFGGVLSDETASPLSGDQTPKYTAGAASTNDWFDVKTIDLSKKQRGEWVGITLYADMTNFSQDVDFVVYDRTNNSSLTKTGLDILVGGQAKSRYSFSVFIPDTCTQISFGCHMVNAPVNTESFLIDDVEFSLNPFVYKEIARENVFSASVANNGTATLVSENSEFIQSVTRTGLGTVQVVWKTGFFNEAPSVQATANISNHNIISVFSVTNTGAFFECNDSTGTKQDRDFYITVQRQGSDYGQTTEHIITPMKSPVEYDVSAQLSGTGWTIHNARAIYYKTGDGSHWITFTVKASKPNDTYNAALTFSGITPSYNQAIVTSFGVAGVGTAADISTSGNIAVTSTSATATGDLSGTIRLDSKPTWADDVSNNFLAAVPVEQVAYIKDIKTSGTNGGNSSVNTVQTRDLNTIAGDLDIVSLSSNQFTLKSGKYDISASCPAFQVDQHQAFLYNVTDSIYQIDGSCEYAETVNMVGTNRSFVEGVLTITKNTVFELRHWTSDGVTSGLGIATDVHASNPQSGEVYSVVRIRKLR